MSTDERRPDVQDRSPRAVRWALVAIVAAGVVLRIVIAWFEPAPSGDPTFSYVYRALLIADGEWSGLKLMWHPPGYPMLLAALTLLTCKLLHPILLGQATSILCFVGIAWAVDRILSRRGESAAVRLLGVATVAFYEGFLIIGTQPLSEGPFLLATLGVLLLTERHELSTTRCALLGALLGCAVLVRLDGLGAAAGALLWILLLARSRSGFSGRGTRAVVTAGPFLFAFLVVCGWVLFDRTYMGRVTSAQQESFTVAVGERGPLDLQRLAESFYAACTVWIPQTVLLPFLVLVSVGLFEALGRAEWRRFLARAFLFIGPCALMIAASIQHKRTGSILLPMLAILAPLGVGALARTGVTVRWWSATVWSAAWILVLIQPLRIPLNLGTYPYDGDTAMQGRLLADFGRAKGPVWAFGGEPEVLAFAGWAVPVPFFDRAAMTEPICAAEEEGPVALIEALEQRGFRYLALTFRESLVSPAEREAQRYGDFSCHPRRGTVDAIRDCPGCLGLRVVGEDRASEDGPRVAIYELNGARESVTGRRP